MARMLVFDGDECLWNVFVKVLESEGYTVCKACNDKGLPHPCTELIALTLRTIQYVVAFCLESALAGSAGDVMAFPRVTGVPLC
jgi:hypothetical protein